MATIDWDEFKEYKQGYQGPQGHDNFRMLISFMRSFYNVYDAHQMYDLFMEDTVGVMMLKKRGIASADALERFLDGLR